jgi:hypothetical protein
MMRKSWSLRLLISTICVAIALALIFLVFPNLPRTGDVGVIFSYYLVMVAIFLLFVFALAALLMKESTPDMNYYRDFEGTIGEGDPGTNEEYLNQEKKKPSREYIRFYGRLWGRGGR